MSESTVLHLDPTQIVIESNTRHSLKPSRIAALVASILELGGVQTPITVEPADEEGKYRLIAGHYRVAAVTQANAEGAGLTIPAIVHVVQTPAERLRLQLSENMDRENQSPMDTAVAIKALLDAGTPRAEVRRLFARPSGKRGDLTPVSNAWVNIMVGLLSLPKSIQAKIHDGIIGLGAAYELGKVSPDKRAAVVARAEAEVAKQAEIEEADEAKFLTAQAKAEQAAAKLDETTTALTETEALITTAKALVKERTAILREYQGQPILSMPADERKKAIEAVKAAEADLKAAQKTQKDAEAKLEKLKEAQATAKEKAQAKAKELAETQKAKKIDAKKAKEGKVGAADIKKAAKAEGEDTGLVPLTISEAREAVRDVAKQTSYAKVSDIGMLFKSCLAGGMTPKELIEALAEVTGEKKAKAKK